MKQILGSANRSLAILVLLLSPVLLDSGIAVAAGMGLHAPDVTGERTVLFAAWAPIGVMLLLRACRALPLNPEPSAG